MAFELPPLPYDYSALDPTISEETMKYHHDKHHKAYTDNLNAGVAESGLEGKSIEDIAKLVEVKFPYELNYQKPLTELLGEVEADLQLWELTIGNVERSKQIWTIRVQNLETELAALRSSP